MVVREPNLYDLYAATLLISGDDNLREDILSEWLSMRKDSARYRTRILIHKKKVQAIMIVNTVWDENFILIMFLGDRDSKTKLLKKYKQEYPNDTLIITTTEPLEDLKFLGFKIKSYNLELKGSVK